MAHSSRHPPREGGPDDTLGDPPADGWSARLSQAAAAVGGPDQAEALRPLVRLLRDGGGAGLWPRLAGSPRSRARRLALALVRELAEAGGFPHTAGLIPTLAPLLADRRIPRDEALPAAVVLTRARRTEAQAEAVVRSLMEGVGKSKSLRVRALLELEKQTGPLEAARAIRDRLDAKVRLTCPLCGARGPRAEIDRHLWESHRLVLDGEQAREPWRLIETWLEDHRRTGDQQLVRKSEELAARVDPGGWQDRLQRLRMSKQVGSASIREALTAQAAAAGASVCPFCFALVPPRPAEPVRPLTCSRGRIAGAGYAAEVSERGYRPRLELLSPDGVVFAGPEPGRWLSRPAAMFFFAGPPLAVGLFLLLLPGLISGAAAVLALGPPGFAAGGTQRVVSAGVLFLVLSLMCGLLVDIVWPSAAGLRGRAVAHAWRVLLPRLHADGFRLADSAFLAGLVQLGGRASARESRRPEHRDRLRGLITLTEQAVERARCPVSHLAALRRRQIEDAAADGRDPLELIAREVHKCLLDQVPLTFADFLLAGWGPSRWTAFQRSRLRVLLCDRAFDAGYELNDLLRLGTAAPLLAEVLGVRDLAGLARLRLLWSLRAEAPWDFAADAQTVFDLAENPEAAYPVLEDYPDLLLVSRADPAVLVVGQDLLYRGVRFPGAPTPVLVCAHAPAGGGAGGGWQVVFAGRAFDVPGDAEHAEAVAEALEAWLEFLGTAFVPRLAEVKDWKSPGEILALRLGPPTRCPDCRRPSMPLVGDVGVIIGPG